mmetsp:Transcript_27421/g.67679  ORF Transcript_27421/g.67679 Transcript_27421/m.67679 type:complete len:286 (+) Transcript_27421:25-882(+)
MSTAKKERPSIRALGATLPDKPAPQAKPPPPKPVQQQQQQQGNKDAGSEDDDDPVIVPGVIPSNVKPLESDAPGGLVPRYQSALDALLSARGEQRTAKLSFKELGDVGASKLSQILGTGTCKNLVGLDISCNSIRENGAKALANSLSANSSIVSLDMSANAIGDEGATALSSGLAFNRTTQNLDLHACSIGDAGAKALAGVLLDGNASLAALNLKANYIGDEGATALAQAVRKSKSLRCLITASNDIGKAGQAALDAAFDANEKCSPIVPRGEHDNIVGEVCVVS